MVHSPSLSPLRPLKNSLISKKRIGLLGGSFNPPHEGHIHISKIACDRLCLDEVWWMVAPANPLKDIHKIAPYKTRVDWCREMTKSYDFINVSDLENQQGLYRTVDTVTFLKQHLPLHNFVWVAGMDIAHEISRWRNWRLIPSIIPLCFVGRKPWASLSKRTVFSSYNSRFMTQKYIKHSQKIALNPNTVFWVKETPVNPLSSTGLRRVLDFSQN